MKTKPKRRYRTTTPHMTEGFRFMAPPDVAKVIRKAAVENGQTVSDFVRRAAIAAATKGK